MKLSIGIVGLPNVGKSTLFKILTKQEVNIANYPFATIDPNVGMVLVPDERLEELAKISGSKKIISAIVEFYDIAGLVRGANKGEGLGNQFLSHIRETSAIVQIIRCFKNSEIIHIESEVDPLRDLETINMELILKDLETIEKRLVSLEKESKSGDKQKIKGLEILEAIKENLNASILINNMGEIIEDPIVKELNLLTAKKTIYLLNGKKEDVGEKLKDRIKSLNADYLIIDLSDSLSMNSVGELIKKAYQILGLISFFTTGEDETRAWTIKDGFKAPQAAGEIHTDFEKRFIKAEVIGWKRLLDAGDWQKAKQKGALRLEGKEYIVQDGDVMVIKHG